MDKNNRIEENEIHEIMSEQVKNSVKIRKLLNVDFLNKLQNRMFTFREIKAQDIIDIVYEKELKDKPNELLYISTERIANSIGVDLIRTEENKSENAGSIMVKDDKQLVIEYCESNVKHKKRFIRAHEIGHLFIHLINGIKMEFIDKKTINETLRISEEVDNLRMTIDMVVKYNLGNNTKDILQQVLKTQTEKLDIHKNKQKVNMPLAAFKNDTDSYTEKQRIYEKEANIFANELLLSEKNLTILLSSKYNISANSVLEKFNIEATTLQARLKDKNINLDDEDNSFNIIDDMPM